jgi:hypothetical protein
MLADDRGVKQHIGTVVALLRNDDFSGVASFTAVGAFVPLQQDLRGRVVHKVSLPCFLPPLRPPGKAAALVYRAGPRIALVGAGTAARSERRSRLGTSPAGPQLWPRRARLAGDTRSSGAHAVKLIPLVTPAVDIDATDPGTGWLTLSSYLGGSPARPTRCARSYGRLTTAGSTAT